MIDTILDELRTRVFSQRYTAARLDEADFKEAITGLVILLPGQLTEEYIINLAKEAIKIGKEK